MWQKNVLYLDYNASAGISHEVRKALAVSLNDGTRWVANPSSAHQWGQREDASLRSALVSISRSLGGVDPSELIPTSSGTESNQAVLATLARDCAVLFVGAGEHPASWDCVPHLQERHPDLQVFPIPLTGAGAADLSVLAERLREIRSRSSVEGSVLRVGISLAWANNETGVLLDLESLSKVVAESGVPCRIHLDGAQAWGKLPVDLKRNLADYVTFSSHKIGAPAGAGLIWRRSSAPFFPVFPGDGNQGRRGGSMNGIGLLGLGEAARHVHPEAFQGHTQPLRDRFEGELKRRIPGVRVFGDQSPRVGNTSRFGFEGFSGYADWVELLDLEGFAVSRGSACKSGSPAPSRVLLSMGVPEAIALNSLRVSTGPDISWEGLERFLNALCSLHEKKRMSL